MRYEVTIRNIQLGATTDTWDEMEQKAEEEISGIVNAGRYLWHGG
jgi:hypothetical protein